MFNIVIVVEDKQEEQTVALEAIKRATNSAEVIRSEITPGCPIVGLKSLNSDYATEVLFANNLESAKKWIKYTELFRPRTRVGVITDLMFPLNKGGKEEPNGLGVIAECITEGIPVVVCSDTDHHEVKWMNPIFPILGKAHPLGNIPIILDKKDWGRAVTLLAEIVNPAAVT